MYFEVHNISTRKNSDSYEPLSHLTVYKKGPFYMGIKVYKQSATWNKRFVSKY